MSHDAEAAATIDEITDGGERVVHLRTDESFYDHLSIYQFASQFCKGRTVLDAGCGTGYGAAYLAEHGAEHVHGIDISPKAVAFSQTHFQRPNLQFHTIDLANISIFPRHSFDVITAFNALEHIADISAFLRSACGLLNPAGTMLVAVPPITDAFLFAVNIANQYHLNIWTPAQWNAVFRGYFGQSTYYIHNRNKPDLLDSQDSCDPSTTEYVFEAIPFDQMLTHHTVSAIFLLSEPVAEDQLPDPGEPIAFVDGSFTRSPDDRAMAIIAQVMAQREQLIARLNQSAAEQQARIQQLEAAIGKKNEHIAELKDLLQRIESGRLLRILHWFRAVVSRQ